MKLRELTIEKQLRFGFGILAFIVLITGIIAYVTPNLIHRNTVIMYEHSVRVRRAIHILTNESLKMSVSLRNAILADDGEQITAAYEEIQTAKARAYQNWPVLRERYLESSEDIDAAYQLYIIWVSKLDSIMEAVRGNEVNAAIDGIQPGGPYDIARERFFDKMLIIDQAASDKKDELYAQSLQFKNTINYSVILIVLSMLYLGFKLSKFIYGSIKSPLGVLIRVARDVQKSNLTVRCNLKNNTEFGEFASVFDMMLDSLESNDSLRQKSVSLSDVMLSLEDAKEFFQGTLSLLAEHTGAQIAAVYLLSDDKTSYELFVSIGMDAAMRRSFDRESFEGELGLATASKKIQRLNLLDDETRFSYPAASGGILPREIITIPIAPEEEVIAVISLAAVNRFSGQAMELLKDTLAVMSARIHGILAYRDVNKLKDELSEKNQELEIRQIELREQAFEMVEQNRELERQKEELGELNRLKTSFLSNMSHELRTPLNAIIALSGVLSRRLAGQIPEEEQSYLEVIDRSGKSLLELINDLLNISKIESGIIDLDVDRFSLIELINEIKAMLDPFAKQKSIQMIFEYNQADADICIVSDRGKCRQIIQNLLGNAVKFTEDGHVKISVSAKDDMAAIAVTDTGIGISEKQMLYIFDEFRQADGGTTRKYGGTGLGLAIAKKYSELLGGRIEVESILGQGSTFTLMLPLLYTGEADFKPAGMITVNDIERKNSSYSRISKACIPETPRRILVVEDSEAAIVQIRDVMEESGLELMIARDGIEAIKLVEACVPDAIILDLLMPRADGFQVLKTIRENEHTMHVPVLILTAKHISRDELSILKKNNIRQLIQKGNVDRCALKRAIDDLFHIHEPKDKADGIKLQDAGAAAIRQTEEEAAISELPITAVKPVILAVEDNSSNMLAIRALLKDRFTVIEASDGEQAMDLAKTYLPDLILMDIALPGIDGVDTFRAIRGNKPTAHIPVIALTASALTTDRDIFLAYGFDAYISKPIIEEQFIKIIEGVVYGA